MLLLQGFARIFKLKSLQRFHAEKLKEFREANLSQLDRERLERKLNAISDILKQAEDDELIARRQTGS